jgi:cysteinyl-tRNA synthetase
MPFHIFNTLSRSVEEFKPQHPPTVTLYSCGPTVYLPQHLGNFRTFLNWDFLKRALKFDGYRVRQIMNITDVGHMTSDEDAGEDKIEKTARLEGKSPLDVANHYTELFLADWDRLNMERPERFTRATEHIPEMIALIGKIIDAGYAYVTKSGVYFDVERYRGENRFGRLSRQSLDEQHASNRLEHSSDKHSPHDFALWMLDQPNHILQWPTPWGPGYPGWHIECSAMAMKYLGETLDIHTGGMDHIPIHHENEIAQSESATHKPFVRYFVHSAFLVGREGAKISKSAGKFPLLSDLPNIGVDPLAFRLFCFGAKYRSELSLSDEGLRAAQGNLDYFREFARNVPAEAAAIGAETPGWAEEFYERFHAALDNDLNTPQALAVALDLVAESYRRADFGAWPTLLTFDAVLGLNLSADRETALGATISPAAQALMDERAEARRSKNFKRSDELRTQLESLGYEVKDNRDGTTDYRPRSV